MDGWTTPTVIAGSAAVLAVIVAIALTVALVRLRRAAERQLARMQAKQDEFAERLDALTNLPLAAQPSSSDVSSAEASATETAQFVITDVGTEQVAAVSEPTRIEGRLFADVVLRESVVKAASWTHGMRTALSAENRNRIRFEMKRETKRSTKQRKADTKEALRQYYAHRERPTIREDHA